CGKTDVLQRAAHTLKSTTAAFGAEGARQAAFRLETIARNGDLDLADEASAALEEQIERLMPQVAALAVGDVQ
ncbi:MAG: Hpt domain-containing protein, partial [Armatimonadota bacterium]